MHRSRFLNTYIDKSRRNTALDFETVDWVNRVNANRGKVSERTIFIVNKWLVNLKKAGLRHLIKRVNLYCGNSLASAQIPIIRDPNGGIMDTLFNFVETDFSEKGGIKGDGATKYINTGLSPANAQQTLTSMHIGVFCLTSADEGAEEISSGGNACGGWANGYVSYLGSTYFDCWFPGGGGQFGPVTDSEGTGFYLYTRRASDNVEVYKNGKTIITGTTTNGSLPGQSYMIFCQSSCEVAEAFSSKTHGMYTIGTSLTPTEAHKYYQITKTVQRELGRTWTQDFGA
jgi:hypothetical protein